MYILTSKYFPTDSWPDLYFPTLPAGANIQYTEVMEFSVAAILSAEFSVVLPNDEIGYVAAGVQRVIAGAGTSAANGTYSYSEVLYGKPLYRSGSNWLYWIDFMGYLEWRIEVGGIRIYYSTDNVATPDLCTTWTKATAGSLPVPTVTKSLIPVLTEVAAFTVEMPMVVEMEVYEELSA